MIPPLAALVPAALALALAPSPPVQDEPVAASLDAEIDGLVEELRAAGFPIDREQFTVERRALRDVAPDLDAQQDAFFRENHFEALWHFYRAAGYELGSQPSECRAFVSRAMASGFVAYYQFTRKALVSIDSMTNALSHGEELLLHELVHAWRDQTTGIAKLLATGDRTFEGIKIKQCLIEGEAQAVAAQVLLAREGKELGTYDALARDDSLVALTAGQGVASLYTNGLRYFCDQLAADGSFLTHWPERLPPSSEQLLHPEKHGSDVPVVVHLPDWPADASTAMTLAFEDTIGEFGVFAFLAEFGVPLHTARLASIGWDGDRLRYWKNDEDVVLCWRVAFDRELDARQFASAWEPFDEIDVDAHDAVAVWTYGTDVEALDTVRLALVDVSDPARDPQDAASTAALEDALGPPPGEPRVEGERWIVPSAGLSLPAPDGWTATVLQGTPFLRGPNEGGFADNINVSTFANTHGADAAAILAENEAYFAGTDLVRYHTGDVRRVAGVDCVYITYGATMGGAALEFRVLIVPRGKEQIILTATLLSERAETMAPLLDAVLLDVRLD